MTLVRVPIYSPNYSTRGAGVRLIVLHTSEGATTYQSLGNFFASPSSAVSSHVGIDDTPNTVGEYVQRAYKAWTAANANPVAVQAELCTPSGGYKWTRDQWMTHPNMLANAAQWIKEEATFYGIPIVNLTPNQAQTTGKGVCQHVDLGAWGGSHVDCGSGFPIDYVLSLASNSNKPVEPTEGAIGNMVITDPITGGQWICDPTSSPPGAVFTLNGAKYCGGTNNAAMNAQNCPCVGITNNTDKQGGGYTIILDFSKASGKPDDYRSYNFPYNGSGMVK